MFVIRLSDFLAYGENSGRQGEVQVRFGLTRWEAEVPTKSVSQIPVSLQPAPQHSRCGEGSLALNPVPLSIHNLPESKPRTNMLAQHWARTAPLVPELLGQQDTGPPERPASVRFTSSRAELHRGSCVASGASLVYAQAGWSTGAAGDSL